MPVWCTIVCTRTASGRSSTAVTSTFSTTTTIRRRSFIRGISTSSLRRGRHWHRCSSRSVCGRIRSWQRSKRRPGTILFVGDSEDRNKGARFLIEACARLQHECDFRLLFKDKKESDMKVVPPLVWEYGLKRFVEYVPRLSTDALVRLYNSAQIVVSPSLYEGFGLPAAEAMACGTPVIATTAGAFPEFIDDGRPGVPVG